MPAARIHIEIRGDAGCEAPALRRTTGAGDAAAAGLSPEADGRGSGLFHPDDGRDGSGAGAVAATPEVVTVALRVPRVVDGPQADALADLLISQVDAAVLAARDSGGMDAVAPVPTVTRLTVRGLLLTPRGMHGLQLFLALHADTLRHVVLRDLGGPSSPDDGGGEGDAAGAHGADGSSGDDPVLAMVHGIGDALSSAPLETIELGHLTLRSAPSSASDPSTGGTLAQRLWRPWAVHTGLRMLKLDNVTLDDGAMQQLQSQMQPCWGSLRDLYCVWSDTQFTPAGLEAADRLLRDCVGGGRLVSLRWVNRGVAAATPNRLPMAGLRDLVNGGRDPPPQPLLQLVLEGCILNEHEVGQLCGVLSELSQLVNIKLRNLQLSNAHTQALAQALRRSQAPIANMDWSGNSISQTGLRSILDLVCQLKNSIQSLWLNSNKLDRDCFDAIIDFLQVYDLADVDIRLQDNPFDAERIAPLLALALWDVRRERDEAMQAMQRLQDQRDYLQQELDRSATASNDDSCSGSGRVLKLEQENVQLKEELAILKQALAIVGSANAIEQNSQLLERVIRLEGKIASMNNGNGSTGQYSRQGSGRDVAGRRGSGRGLAETVCGPQEVGVATPRGTRRSAKSSVMETPHQDRQTSVLSKPLSPEAAVVSSMGMDADSSHRSRWPPSASKSADACILHRMKHTGSKADHIPGNETTIERVRASNRRPAVARSLSANVALTASFEDMSSQPDVITNRSGRDDGWKRLADQMGRRSSLIRTGSNSSSARMHQSYNSLSSTDSIRDPTDIDRMNQSSEGFPSNWELDDVKETPFEDNE